MLNISFICLGNICRSPMAEAIFKKMAEERGISSSLNIKSFATSDYEEGNPVYPPAARTMAQHGIVGFSHRSRQVTLADIKNSDYVLLMDHMNMTDVVRFTGGMYGDRIFLLGHFLTPQIEIADPYYTRDFERAWSDISSACAALLDSLLQEK